MLKIIKSFVARLIDNEKRSTHESKILCHIGKWYIVHGIIISKSFSPFYKTGKLNMYRDYFPGKGLLNETGWAVYHYRLVIMHHVFDLVSLEPYEWFEINRER